MTTTDPRARLDEIKERAEVAVSIRDVRGVPIVTGYRVPELATLTRADVPAMAAALTAVLNRHRRVPIYDDECADMDCTREHVETDPGEFYHADSIEMHACEECTDADGFMDEYREYPCLTVRDITDALGGDRG